MYNKMSHAGLGKEEMCGSGGILELLTREGWGIQTGFSSLPQVYCES